MKLYFNYLKLNLKAQLEYKWSFILNFFSQFAIFFTYYFIIIALFDKFNNISGFTIYEVLVAFGIIQFGFSFNETFFRGIDKFDDLIIKGDYDRLLLRPRNIFVQILGSQFDFVKISRIIQSLIVLIIAFQNLNITWNIFKVIDLLLMLLSSILIFFGIFVLSASYCFFTVEGLEVRNLFTDGGKHMAQYPIGVFKKGFILFFTFIIPYAFVNYYPLLYLIDKSSNILYAFSPLLIFIFLIPCFLIFRLSSRRYLSVGS